MKMNLIERERLKAHLNKTLDNWLEVAEEEFLLPDVSAIAENVAAHMAAAALAVIDALADMEEAAKRKRGNNETSH